MAKKTHQFQQTDARGRLILGAAGAALALAALADGDPAEAQMTHWPGAADAAGEVALPDGFREWVFLGAPLTPHGLNDGAAGFPEFHHVYVEPGAWAEYKRSGVWPEGTVIVKELVLLQPGEYPDGSRDEPSGRGFFADRVAGIDMMVKDSVRYAETSGWGFFNYGHHEPPYAARAAAAPAEVCAACHEASAHEDMVFARFYPILSLR